MKRLLTLTAAMVLLAAVLSAPALAYMDCFLAIPGVEGECQYPDLEGAVQFNALRHTVPGLPNGQSLMREPPEDPARLLQPLAGTETLTLCKQLDRASPILLSVLGGDKRFPQLKLALCSQEGDHDIEMTMILKNASVTSYQVFAPGFGDRSLRTGLDESKWIEVLTLNFEEIKIC